MRQASPVAPSSLVRASLDIGRVLADRDGVTFRVQGTCMYPTLRPRDVLHIRSCAAGDVAAGDIAVCRTPEFLFSHRVIATGVRDGRAYVVTRPDRAHGGGDAPVYDDDLLGVIATVERAGRSVPLQPIAHPRILRLYYSVRLAALEAEPRARLLAIALAARVQALPLYRRAARRWYALRRPQLRFVVRVRVNAALGDAVSRELTPADFDPSESWHDRPIERWTLIAQVSDAREAGAWATFVRDPDDAWRLEASSVRVRYRGSGLAEAVLQQAKDILERASRARQR